MDNQSVGVSDGSDDSVNQVEKIMDVVQQMSLPNDVKQAKLWQLSQLKADLLKNNNNKPEPLAKEPPKSNNVDPQINPKNVQQASQKDLLDSIEGMLLTQGLGNISGQPTNVNEQERSNGMLTLIVTKTEKVFVPTLDSSDTLPVITPTEDKTQAPITVTLTKTETKEIQKTLRTSESTDFSTEDTDEDSTASSKESTSTTSINESKTTRISTRSTLDTEKESSTVFLVGINPDRTTNIAPKLNTTPNINSTPNSNDGSGLQKSIIALIVILVIGCIALLCWGLFILYRKKKKPDAQPETNARYPTQRANLDAGDIQKLESGILIGKKSTAKNRWSLIDGLGKNNEKQTGNQYLHETEDSGGIRLSNKGKNLLLSMLTSSNNKGNVDKNESASSGYLSAFRGSQKADNKTKENKKKIKYMPYFMDSFIKRKPKNASDDSDQNSKDKHKGKKKNTHKHNKSHVSNRKTANVDKEYSKRKVKGKKVDSSEYNTEEKKIKSILKRLSKDEKKLLYKKTKSKDMYQEKNNSNDTITSTSRPLSWSFELPQTNPKNDRHGDTRNHDFLLYKKSESHHADGLNPRDTNYTSLYFDNVRKGADYNEGFDEYDLKRPQNAAIYPHVNMVSHYDIQTDINPHGGNDIYGIPNNGNFNNNGALMQNKYTAQINQQNAAGLNKYNLGEKQQQASVNTLFNAGDASRKKQNNMLAGFNHFIKSNSPAKLVGKDIDAEAKNEKGMFELMSEMVKSKVGEFWGYKNKPSDNRPKILNNKDHEPKSTYIDIFEKDSGNEHVRGQETPEANKIKNETRNGPNTGTAKKMIEELSKFKKQQNIPKMAGPYDLSSVTESEPPSRSNVKGLAKSNSTKNRKSTVYIESSSSIAELSKSTNTIFKPTQNKQTNRHEDSDSDSKAELVKMDAKIIEINRDKDAAEIDIFNKHTTGMSTKLSKDIVRSTENEPYLYDGNANASTDTLSDRYDFSIRYKPPLGPMKAIEAHNPELTDELELEVGQVVYIVGEFSDGWILAINKSDGENVGMVPRDCVFLSESQTNSQASLV
ncbi:hypothetical protein AX774_g2967 [Zancudomyces culisetae]|uniref:SH3 domain-containing protein n=1 Tax=Zancudomyces culisetae TaxID=1213189 RepID=A0A1R1PRC2_ZANCU|nr:hypothetical protein AX774_g2967 [Zancudomyces culisetae]|eukprot:OMH83526.1 hypothetical protein AX774_g2967 [Zancudomyces culisetae]